MTSPWIILTVTAAIIALSAFFVIVEFSLLGARRHRLEEAAVSSRGARAALRSVNELTITLAGAQLGITVCTFALGAVTKPAVDTWFSLFFTEWGIPYWLADGTAFVLALLIVTFLHLVIGEMGPKSWAVAHPEVSAMLIGAPSRLFIRPLRPMLLWINNIANRLVKASGVEPVNAAAVGGHNAATIRHLVEHSAEVGSLQASLRKPISGALDLETLRVEDLFPKDTPATTVNMDDTVYDVQKATGRTGHKRVLLMDREGGHPGVIHVRDTLLEPADRPAKELARPSLVLQSTVLLHEALTTMQQSSEQLAVVMEGTEFLGVITINDALNNVLSHMGEQ